MDIKKDLDSAIDSSDNDEKLTENLVMLHNKYYGKNSTNELIDTLYDDKDPSSLQEYIIQDIKNFDMKDANKAVASEMYKMTPEQKYLQPIYDYVDPRLKALSLLEKPISTAVAAGRTVGKGANAIINALNPDYGVPFDGNVPLLEELKTPFPTPEGSLTADLRENYPQEGFLKDTLPKSIKGAFPKASSVIENFGAYDVADIGTAAVTPTAIKMGSEGSLENSIAKTRERIKTALIRSSDDVQFAHDLNKSGKLDNIVDLALNDKKILSKLDNPFKLQDYIEGIKVKKRDPITGKDFTAKLKEGALDKAGKKITEEISKHSGIGGVDIPVLYDNIINSIRSRIEKIGSGLSESSFDPLKVEKEIDSFVKPVLKQDGGDVLSVLMSKKRTPEQLVQIKRGVSDFLFQAKKVVDLSEGTTLKKIVAEELWKEMDNQINTIGDITGDYGIIKANNHFSDLATLRDIYGKKPTSEFRIPNLKESMISGGLVGGAAMAMGTPFWQSAILGGIPTAMRAAEGGLAYSMPAMSARAAQIAQKGYGLMSKIPNAPLAVTLASYEIPRNTQKIMQESDLVLAKIAQNTTTPEGQVLFDAVHDAIKNAPNKVPKLMQILSQQMPGIFQYSEYNSFDNIVPEQNRSMALKKINNSKNLDNSQKAQKIKALINEGYLDEF